ncbi:hypothetical protein FOL47_004906 [Perkinsus chesapeaki]|uniref:Uncharacterized protein n=1 Tax=Perkinsus chesapeaki TaxID=330153 RepID=A0A7J6M157_PERCH|nr:hypothetical protein FOL47_004906 [Perkinsus chesapeaki]
MSMHNLADEKSLVSIEKECDSSMVDVRDLPAILREAGVSTEDLPEECRTVPEFLANAKVETLKAVKIQVVETSSETVDTATLEKFLKEAAQRLGGIKTICEGNSTCSIAGQD